jgi:hypothetical protein
VSRFMVKTVDGMGWVSDEEVLSKFNKGKLRGE